MTDDFEDKVHEPEPQYGEHTERVPLAERTKEFAIRIIKLYSALPKATEAQVIGNQLLRSGTSVGAHYREASRARSDAEFVSKLEAGLQELEETKYWIELLIGAAIVPATRLSSIQEEAESLTGILVTCIRKGKSRRDARK